MRIGEAHEKRQDSRALDAVGEGAKHQLNLASRGLQAAQKTESSEIERTARRTSIGNGIRAHRNGVAAVHGVALFVGTEQRADAVCVHNTGTRQSERRQSRQQRNHERQT